MIIFLTRTLRGTLSNNTVLLSSPITLEIQIEVHFGCLPYYLDPKDLFVICCCCCCTSTAPSHSTVEMETATSYFRDEGEMIPANSAESSFNQTQWIGEQMYTALIQIHRCCYSTHRRNKNPFFFPVSGTSQYVYISCVCFLILPKQSPFPLTSQ